jgi:CotS family spore coat protein
MDNARMVSEKLLSSRELELVKEICAKYGVNVQSVVKIRSVYKVKYDDNKSICLKRMKSGKKKVIRGNKLIEALNNNGFYNTVKYFRTINGNLYVKYKKFIFYATEWIEGRECNFDNLEEACGCVKLLAEFHKTTNKLGKKHFNVYNNLKNWPNIFKENLSELERFKNVINKKVLKSEFDIVYLKNMDRFLDRALMAINILSTSSYYKISKKANHNKTICHDSFYYQNVIEKNGEYYLIDFDSIMIDLQINDLGKLIRRLMYKGTYKWEFEKAKKLIEAYIDVNPLSKEELEVMLSLIIFPHKFWKLGKKKYYKRKNWSEIKYMHKLKKLIKYNDFQHEFVKKYFEYLNEL